MDRWFLPADPVVRPTPAPALEKFVVAARLPAVFAIVLLGIAALSVPAMGAGQEVNTNRPGGDYTYFEMRRAVSTACANTCASDPKCFSWTYVKPGVQGRLARCWLKKTIPKAVPDSCCVSGVTRVMQFKPKLPF
jgi:hypothetical protein